MSGTSESTRPGKRRGWIFKLSVVFGVLVALLVVAYFVVTSGAFIKGVILPRAGAAMNADISAIDVSLSPWSELTIQGFKLQPNGKETLFEAEQIHARYSLWDIIRGKIVVQEAGVTGPVVTYVLKADGTSNVDPLLKKNEAAKPSTPSAPKTSAPPQVDIKNIYLKNARVNFSLAGTNGSVTAGVISNFDFTIDQIQNGQTSKLAVGGGASVRMTAVKDHETNSSALDAKLAGAFALKFTPALAPETVSGNTRLDVVKAGGALSNLTALAAIVDCDLSLTDIRKASVRVEQNGVALAEVRASGPFSLANKEGHIKLEAGPIDRRALNIVGGPLHIDFNKTAISSTNEIDVKQNAKVIAVNGSFIVNDFSATLTNGVTPTLNIRSAYVINADLTRSNAVIQQFNVDGARNQTPFLKVSLSKPMPIDWGAGAGAPDEASMDLLITNFNLADWAGFAGNLAPAGMLDTSLHVLSRKAGKQLTIDLNTGLRDFGATFASNQITKAAIQLAASAGIDDFKQIALNSYKLDVSQNGNTAISASGSGTVNTQTQDADVKAAFEARIPQLLQVASVPGMTFQSGAVRFDGHVAKKNGNQTVVGTLAVTNLSGSISNMVIDRLQAKFDTDIAINGADLKINRMTGAFEQGGQPGGGVDIKGGLNLTNKQGVIALQATDINQNLIKPFAAPSLAGKHLDSISINANLTATLAASNSFGVTGGFGVSNLVVRATNQALMLDRFQAQFDSDIAMNGSDLTIRKLSGVLRQSGLPAGSLDVKGGLNLTNKQGQISLLLTNVNQNLLKPVLAGSIPGKELASVAINANVNTTLGASNAFSVLGGLGISNLVVRATNQAVAPAPLSAQFKIDAGMQASKFDIRQFQITLSPTDRAKNQIDVKGQADLSVSNAYNANLTVSADSIDVTPLYDQLTGGAQPAADPAQPAQPAKPAQPAQPSAPAAPRADLPPLSFPVGLATVDLKIGKFVLREIEITNWHAALRAETNTRIAVNPFHLSLNGAPVTFTANADTGVPGYRYQISLGMDKVPLEPLANSFLTNARGAYKGAILANVTINGVGTSDLSLRSNLNAQVAFSVTNASIQITNAGWFTSSFLSPIVDTLSKVSTVSSVSQVLSDPLNSVSSSTSVGQGKITVQSTKLLSAAFYADVHGDIPMTNVLMDSPLNLPVTFALSQSIAKKIPYLSSLSSDTNAAYVTIPDFVKLGGTLGNPKTAATLPSTQALMGAAEALGKKFGGAKANDAINALGNLLNKPSAPAGTNAPGTNAAPAQPSSPVNDLMNMFKKK